MVERRLRAVFLGTPQFAVPSLEALAGAGYEIAAVYTQPDRPKGRGREIAAPPVKQCAERLGLPVFQPERIRRPEVVEQIEGFGADVMAVVGYGQIIPQSIISLPPLGIVNVHASLLPKYRGAGPIQWAIANCETRTGVTTMRIDAGLDTGAMLLKRETDIAEEEDAIELGRRLSILGAELLVETIAGLAAGAITPQPQDDAAATYAPLLKKQDGWIDWTLPARAIHCRVRGFQPWPGCHTLFRGHGFHIWRARVSGRRTPLEPGSLFVENRQLFAACGGDSALELIEVQMEGRKRMPVDALLNGLRLDPGERLG